MPGVMEKMMEGLTAEVGVVRHVDPPPPCGGHLRRICDRRGPAGIACSGARPFRPPPPNRLAGHDAPLPKVLPEGVTDEG